MKESELEQDSVPQAEKSKAAEIVDDYLDGKINESEYQTKLLGEFERRKKLLEPDADAEAIVPNESRKGFIASYIDRFLRNGHNGNGHK